MQPLSASRRRCAKKPIGFELLPEEFTLADLQHLYETLLNTEFDKANFRKKILAMDLLIALDKTQKAVRHRPARLYRLTPRATKHFPSAAFTLNSKALFVGLFVGSFALIASNSQTP